MAASPSQKEISAARRRGLNKLKAKLAEKGIESYITRGGKYRAATLYPTGTNVEFAGYRVLRASNGEVALLPSVTMKPGESGRCHVVEGWDAFDSIHTPEGG